MKSLYCKQVNADRINHRQYMVIELFTPESAVLQVVSSKKVGDRESACINLSREEIIKMRDLLNETIAKIENLPSEYENE